MTNRPVGRFPAVPGLRRAAIISSDGRYRYRLSRWWEDGERVLFVMLNPSAADAEVDDPTIRRCIGFARSWGFRGLEVANLFGLRTSDPRVLATADDPVGPDNDDVLLGLARTATVTVAGWGSQLPRGRLDRVAQLASALGPIHCLGRNRDGRPRHPLYLPRATELQDFIAKA